SGEPAGCSRGGLLSFPLSASPLPPDRPFALPPSGGSVMEPRPSTAFPVTRRSFLRTGMLALSGVGLADVLRLRAQAQEAGRPTDDTAVILLWLPGGPPHMETYDMKPDAPEEYRGEFKPIPTNVPGVQVCELL